MVNVDGKAPEAEEGDFQGEHEKGEVYTAQNTRAIDVIMELFTMLKGDKMYGQPGTDGTFWSNILETIKNDNDFISIFYLNKAHPFGKGERMIYFALCVFLNMVINSYMGLIEGINKNLVSLLVSVVLVIVKKFIRYIYEAPCMSHDMAASDLRDGMDPDEVVKKNEERQKNIQGPLNSVIYVACFGSGAASIVSAYSNLEIAQYILTLAFNVVIFAFLMIFFNVAMGKYGKDREEFEKRWGALKYDGKYLHPKNIGEVAEAIVKNHGGRENALKHLDSKSRDNYYCYFGLEGEDKDLLTPEFIEKFRSCFQCLHMNETMTAKYEGRFDGVKTFSPYNLETKGLLYGKGLGDVEMSLVSDNEEVNDEEDNNDY